MKIKDISRINGREVFIVRPNTPLDEAVKELVKHHIGAVPVCDFKGKLVGMFSERDIINWISKGNTDFKNSKVKDIMTEDVVIGEPEHELEEILKAMTSKGIRHLPVMSGGIVVGILSLRDVIEEQLTECSTQVRYLHDYIAGGQTQA
jgi:CBS domain-containing protein